MTRQIYLFTYGCWSPIIQETSRAWFAIDLDGVTVCVVKNGTEQIRVVE